MLLCYVLKRILLCMAAILMSGQVTADDFVIYGGESFQPQIYLKNGTPSGIIPALLERLSKDTGDTYQLVLVPWKRALSEATAGHGGITSISRTEARASVFDFSDPLYKNLVKLTVLKTRAAEFKDISDLTGKTLGLPLGTQFGGAFDQAVSNKTILIDADSSPESRIKKLLRGRIDVAVLGGPGLKETIRLDPYLMENYDKLTILPFPLTEDWMYLAFPKSMHRQAAMARFNKALAALKKTREYQKIIDDNSPE